MASRFNWFHSNETKNKMPESTGEVCCGAHEICEMDTLVAFESTAVYYDDEELDIYKNRLANNYTNTEIETFESIFYTLKPEDVAGWLRSLQVREIEPPQALKEEALFIVSERRSKAQ